MKAVSWQRYAAVYDLMAANNPAYQALLVRCRRFLTGVSALPIRSILDAGAGTGNFSLAAAGMFQEASVVHLEPDPAMNAQARDKANGNRRWSVLECPIEQAQFPAACFDVVLSVHALYAMPQPRIQLGRLAEWLRPGGQAFLCDFGRVMNVADWRKFMFSHLRLEKGLLGAIRILWLGREVARQNRKVAHLQKSGRFWLHTADEFRASVEAAGLQVVGAEVVYRRYSDLICAQKG